MIMEETRNFVRFIFSKLDRERMESNLGAIRITEMPVNTSLQSPWGAAQPESLVVEFPVVGDWAPRLSPIFPGDLTFIADPNQELPQVDAVTIVNGSLSVEAEARLKLTGTIHIVVPYVRKDSRLHNGKLLSTIKDLDKFKVPGIGYAPLHAWYSTVTLTKDFLQAAFLNPSTRLTPKLLLAKKIAGKSDAEEIADTDPNWPRYAISQFVRARYSPTLYLGATSDQDDAE